MEFVDKYEAVLKVLLARNPQLIFAHFHFLLEGTELLIRFIHIVHAQVGLVDLCTVHVQFAQSSLSFSFSLLSQPFEERKKWFYENLYHGSSPSQTLSLAANNNEIIVDRGTCNCVCRRGAQSLCLDLVL